MPVGTEQLVVDAQGRPVPQYFNDHADQFEPIAGQDGSMSINSVRRKFRDDFVGASLDAASWEVVQTGSGHTVGVGTVASSLTIDTGTTINTETIIRSLFTISIPTRVQWLYMLSQRIANQEFYFELIDAIDGSHVARFLLDGTSSTTGKFGNAHGGVGPSDTTNTSWISSGSLSLLEIEAFLDEIYWNGRTLNSTSGASSYGMRFEKIPDPERPYKVQIRVKNLGTAPASTTRLTVDSIVVADIQELTAEVTASRGVNVSARALPVTIQGSVTVQSTASLIGAPDTTTNLGSGATFTGSGRDSGSTPTINRARVMIAHTAGSTPGTLVFEESTDNSTYRETRRMPIPSDGLYREYDFTFALRYWRVRFINGATAQTLMYLASKHMAFDGNQADMPKQHHFVESTTPLGSAATYTGFTMDLGGQHRWRVQQAVVFADQAGTLNMQYSRDGSTWRTIKTQAVSANTPIFLEQSIVARYHRVQYVNGATGQGSFELISTLEAS